MRRVIWSRSNINLIYARVDFSLVVKSEAAKSLETELRQIVDDLGLSGKFRIE